MPSSSATEPVPSEAMEEAEAKAAFHLRMRSQGVRDLRVLRAFELVPRACFVPDRFRAFAARDIAIPIDCGQTLNEPGLIARMIEALGVSPSDKVLQIGAGTGYATAILALLAADVMALERYRALALTAQARLDALAIANAIIVWGDGLDLPTGIGTFDKIIVHGAIDRPEPLVAHLSERGTLIYANGEARIMRLVRDEAGGHTGTALGPCRLQTLVSGLATAL